MSHKRIIFILSLVVTIGIAFIPVLGIRYDNGVSYHGFPANVFAFYRNEGWSLQSLGPFFNIAFYYVIFLLLYKMGLKIKNATV